MSEDFSYLVKRFFRTTLCSLNVNYQGKVPENVKVK